MARSRKLAPYSSSRRWTDSEARAVLSALEASGLSVRAFATREGVDPQRLYYWRKRLVDGGAPATQPAFIEVQRHTDERVEIALLSARVLRVRESIDSSTLRRLVDVLEEESDC